MGFKKPSSSFKYQSYVILSKQDVWTKYLKQDLQRIKDRESLSEAEPATSFDAEKRDIKRANTLRIINEIINLVERAENKVVKNYGKIQRNDDSRTEG